MITYRIIVTKKADQDEAAIYFYIANKFGEIYADQFRSKFIKALTLLAKQPFIGRPAKQGKDIRVVLFSKKNKIIYKLANEEIVILRILHTKTNQASKY